MQIGTHEVTSLSLSTYPKQPSKLFHSPHTLTQLASWYSHDAYMSHPDNAFTSSSDRSVPE